MSDLSTHRPAGPYQWAPQPAPPSERPPGGPSGPPPPGRRRFRPTPRGWLVGTAIALLVVLIAVIGGGYLWLSGKVGQIRRIAVAGLVPASGSSQVFLLAGSDSRAGESAGAASHFGSASQVAGQRSDVIILMRVDTRTGTAAMLSIPRDMFVPIAGTSSSNRINVAFNSGPGELVQTISQDFGIAINHFAQVDFSGLQQLTDAVGGVCMNFPYAVRDGSPTGSGNESGLYIPTPGQHVLDGNMALSLVRSRYYLYRSGGTWRAEGTGDIGRITRQHEYMRALASKLVHSSLHNPFTADKVLTEAVKAVTVDSALSNGGILGLGFHLRGLKPAGIPSWTMPYTAVIGYGGYGDVLRPDDAADRQVISQWETYQPPSSSPTTTAPAVPPSSVSVRVLNGSGRAGQAGTAAASLRGAGFQVASTGDAPSFGYSASVISYAPGHEAAATTVAAHVGGPTKLRQDSSLSGSEVVLTTGSGFTAPPAGGSGSAGAPAGAGAGSGGGAGTGQATLPPWDPTPC